MLRICCILLLFCCVCCSGQVGEQVGSDSVDVHETTEKSTDSIEVSSFRTFEIDQNDEYAKVEFFNSYSDSIKMDDEYFIYEMDSDSLLMRGTHQKIELGPRSGRTVEISLLLDSIRYKKGKTYLFIFPAQINDREIIYFHKDRGLGYFNKENGNMVIEPDTVVFC